MTRAHYDANGAEHQPDDTAPAMGIAAGIILSLPFWAALVWWVW